MNTLSNPSLLYRKDMNQLFEESVFTGLENFFEFFTGFFRTNEQIEYHKKRVVESELRRDEYLKKFGLTKEIIYKHYEAKGGGVIGIQEVLKEMIAELKHTHPRDFTEAGIGVLVLYVANSIVGSIIASIFGPTLLGSLLGAFLTAPIFEEIYKRLGVSKKNTLIYYITFNVFEYYLYISRILPSLGSTSDIIFIRIVGLIGHFIYTLFHKKAEMEQSIIDKYNIKLDHNLRDIASKTTFMMHGVHNWLWGTTIPDLFNNPTLAVNGLATLAGLGVNVHLQNNNGVYKQNKGIK